MIVSEPHRIVKSTLAILLSVHTINMLHVLIIQTKFQCITSIQLVKKVPRIHSPISKSRVQAPEKRGLTQSRAMERVPEREWKSLLHTRSQAAERSTETETEESGRARLAREARLRRKQHKEKTVYTSS